MIAAGPGVQPGRSDALVTLQDLSATFLDVAGATALPGMDGRSLGPCLSGATNAHRPHVRSGLNQWRAASDGHYKLVDDDGDMHLYDLHSDPHEQHDRAASSAAQVERMRPLLDTPSWNTSPDRIGA